MIPCPMANGYTTFARLKMNQNNVLQSQQKQHFYKGRDHVLDMKIK